MKDGHQTSVSFQPDSVNKTVGIMSLDVFNELGTTSLIRIFEGINQTVWMPFTLMSGIGMLMKQVDYIPVTFSFVWKKDSDNVKQMDNQGQEEKGTGYSPCLQTSFRDKCSG